MGIQAKKFLGLCCIAAFLTACGHVETPKPQSGVTDYGSTLKPYEGKGIVVQSNANLEGVLRQDRCVLTKVQIDYFECLREADQSRLLFPFTSISSVIKGEGGQLTILMTLAAPPQTHPNEKS